MASFVQHQGRFGQRLRRCFAQVPKRLLPKKKKKKSIYLLIYFLKKIFFITRILFIFQNIYVILVRASSTYLSKQNCFYLTRGTTIKNFICFLCILNAMHYSPKKKKKNFICLYVIKYLKFYP